MLAVASINQTGTTVFFFKIQYEFPCRICGETFCEWAILKMITINKKHNGAACWLNNDKWHWWNFYFEELAEKKVAGC